MSKNGLWTSPTEFREFSALSPRLQEVATRRMAEWVSAGRVLPNPDEVLRKLGASSLDTYKRLLTDDRVGPGVEILKAGLQSLDWVIAQKDADDAVFEFVEDNFRSLRKTGRARRIIGAVVNAYLYGMQPFERVWRPDGSRHWLEDLKAKPAKWFRYGTEGELRFMTRGSAEGIVLDRGDYPYQFQVARHDDDEENPYGFAVLSRCFWPVAFKKGGIKFWAEFMERWGMPHAVGKLPPGTPEEKVQEMLDQLEGLVRDAVGVIWDNAKVDIITPQGGSSKGGGDLHAQLVEWADNAITTSLLGHQGMVQSTPGKLGGENMAATVRDEIVWSLKQLAAEQLTMLIGDMVEINFGPDAEAPEFEFYEAEEIDKTRVERDEKLVPILKGSGARLSRSYLLDKYNLSEDDLEESAPEESTPATPLPAPDPSGRFSAAPATLHDTEAERNQAALEALTEGISPELAQRFAEVALAPVLEFARNAKSLEEIRDGLPDLFPEMGSADLEEALSKLVYVSELFGSAVE